MGSREDDQLQRIYMLRPPQKRFFSNCFDVQLKQFPQMLSNNFKKTDYNLIEVALIPLSYANEPVDDNNFEARRK